MRPHSRLLAALPSRELRRLEPILTLQPMESKRVVCPEGATIDAVYFPVDSVVSLSTRALDDRDVGIATIGNEGLVGITVVLGAVAMDARERAVVQVPGTAVAMDASEFRAEMDRAGPLAAMMQRYARAFLTQVIQQVACTTMHSIEERCCRWILSTGDRVGADELPMTHESLSQMLGVRRASVTVTVGILQRAGFIQLRRGRLQITDRPGLEAATCECYALVRDVFDRLLP